MNDETMRAKGGGAAGRMRLRVVPERCTGCISCMLACSVAKTGAFSLDEARIRVDRNPHEGLFTPSVCRQCDEAWCVQACPVSALTRDEGGIIRVDEETCIGCRACVGACPYQGVAWNETTGKPLFCDLCDGDPACVRACRFPQAISLVEGEKDEQI